MENILFNITATINGNRGILNIRDAIGRDNESASAGSIRKHVDALLRKGVREADVFINSEGGSTFEATEIVNELKRISNVKIKVGAIAASAATYICAHFHTTAQPNTRFMIHKPSMVNRGNEDTIAGNLKLLKNITAEYRTVYAKKTGKSEAEIEALWSKGDVWMTAREAMINGFIDAIEEKEKITAKAPKIDPRANWTLEDFLEKAPKALVEMEEADPDRFKALNNEYFVGSSTSSLSRKSENPRANWAIDDYLEKDPEALKRMEIENPIEFDRLNSDYFGKRQ